MPLSVKAALCTVSEVKYSVTTRARNYGALLDLSEHRGEAVPISAREYPSVFSKMQHSIVMQELTSPCINPGTAFQLCPTVHPFKGGF